MTRPLRIDVEGGWYHVMARGIERRTIFPDKSYCFHFLDLLAEVSSRYSVEVHAYVLMGNHYHLILRTPHANASAAMQWLNVSFTSWFNAKQERVGHVLQGRFRSTLIDNNGSWLLEMSAYLHLNPVRVSSLGLGKAANKAEASGLVAATNKEVVAERLKVLRSHQWSSYRAYGNYANTPEWLVTDELLSRGGGAKAYRTYVQKFVTRGMDPEAFVHLKERVAIGGREFLDKARASMSRVSPEQPDRVFARRLIPFDQVVSAIESVKGERWSEFCGRRGDWGLPAVLYLARQCSGLTLRELGERTGGMAYKNVSTRIRRFAARLEEDHKLKRTIKTCLAKMTNDET